MFFYYTCTHTYIILYVIYLPFEWQEISLTVLLQESKRNVCEHALPSANLALYVCEREQSSVFQESCPQQHTQQDKKKKTLEHKFYLFFHPS